MSFIINPYVYSTIPGGGYFYKPYRFTQVTSYRTGDEGWRIQNGWYDPSLTFGTVTIARPDSSAPFTTLEENNTHGNTFRFTTRAGVGLSYGDGIPADNIVQDHLHGVEFWAISQNFINWDAAIDGALASTLGGESDWYVASRAEIESLFDHNVTTTASITPPPGFNSSSIPNIRTSTTNELSTGQAFQVFSNGTKLLSGQAKTSSTNYLVIRKLF